MPIPFSFIKRTNIDTTADGKQAVLIIGDSTSAGSNNSTGNGPSPAASTAYYYRRTTTDIVQITSDIVSAPNGTQYPQMCTDYYNATGKKLVVIPCGSGGSNFSSEGDGNDWSTTGTLYAQAVTDAHNALSLLELAKLKYILIASLGINDARGAVALSTIQSDISSLISRLQTDFPGVPIMIEQIGRSETASLNARIGSIRGYLKQVCIDNDNVHIIGGLISLFAAGGYGTDNLHPNQTGNNYRGSMYARWMINASYSKWARSIISSHFDELSSLRKNAIANLIDTNTSSYLEHDCLLNFKTTTKNNVFVDWAFMCTPLDSGFSFTANTSVSTNGSSTYLRTGLVPSMNLLKMGQNDFFSGVKIKTNNTAAGTTAVAFGGADASAGIFSSQVSTNQLGYRSFDNTTSLYAGETAYASSSEYGTSRSSGNKYLYKNGSQISTASVASVSLLTQGIYVGCNNNNGTAANFHNAEYEYFRACKFSTVSQSTFKAAMDTFLASW